MPENDQPEPSGDATGPVNVERRQLIGAVAGVTLASMMNSKLGMAATSGGNLPLRWGVVGTGSIANQVVPMISLADGAELAAVSSRHMATAEEFAKKHDIGKTFDSWQAMAAWDGVDALYVATPTSVREDICIAAAGHGKHVLGEKPFASLESLQRITAACREHGVGFMDGTHFVHHPRTAQIRKTMSDRIGWPWSVDSAFQFSLSDRSNIRFNPKLEPLGAIGDVGWYNMRVAVEFVSSDVDIAELEAWCRRDAQTGAVISASGAIRFDDQSVTTWNCGFDSGALVMDLRICGAKGTFKLDDFVSNRSSNAAYSYLSGNTITAVEAPSAKPAPAIMFEDFAAMVGKPERMAASSRASERTQRWLDAIWDQATANE